VSPDMHISTAAAVVIITCVYVIGSDAVSAYRCDLCGRRTIIAEGWKAIFMAIVPPLRPPPVKCGMAALGNNQHACRTCSPHLFV